MLDQLLSSATRTQILRLLFDGNQKEFYLREIERLSGKSIHAIQQEVKRLSNIDLITSKKDGNRIYYRANHLHPLYLDLISIVEKTVGLVGQLKERLSDSRIECAFVFGSIAKGNEKSESDVDLMVIGDLGMRTLTKLLSGIEEKIGREINPHIYSKYEFTAKVKARDHFITSILKECIKPIIGNVDDYR